MKPACGLIILISFLIGQGCAWRVIPPVDPADPTGAFLSDYGRHSRMALPNEEEIVEFAFGDWDFFAREEKTAGNALAALLGRGQPALGRRSLPPVDDPEDFAYFAGAVRSVRIRVSAEAAADLLEAIDSRWGAAAQTRLYSPESAMWFVEDDAPYHLFDNSNHQTARWLEALGCEIQGAPIRSNFRVTAFGRAERIELPRGHVPRRAAGAPLRP